MDYMQETPNPVMGEKGKEMALPLLDTSARSNGKGDRTRPKSCPPSLNSVPPEDTRIPRDYCPGNIMLYINKICSKSDHDTFQSHNTMSMQGKGAWFSLAISKTSF